MNDAHTLNEDTTYHICTLLADMFNLFASSARSSVDGNAVLLYVSFKTFSCSASARFRFFLIAGSDIDASSGIYADGDVTEGFRGYGDGPWTERREGAERSTDRDARRGIIFADGSRPIDGTGGGRFLGSGARKEPLGCCVCCSG